MYTHNPVKVPELKGKFIFRKKGSFTYVHYEIGRAYNPEKKYNTPTRVVIGKLVNENDRTMMYPNEKFSIYFPSVKVTDMEPPKRRSNCISAGSFMVFEKIIKEYKLDLYAQEAFGNRSGLILDLACYMIVSEDNAYQYYPDYARNHPLFTHDMNVLSDSSISRTLSSISSDEIIDFLDLWNKKQDHRQKIYVSYDSTNKNTQAGDLDFAEFGHAKVDNGTPIINISLAFDKTNRVPLFYEQYPGCINDVSQLRYLIDKIDAYKYSSIGLILDRGYFSKQNIEYMDAKKLSFLMMVKGCKSLVSQLIYEHRGSFEDDDQFSVPGTNINAKTIKHVLFPGDREKRYFHLCFNPMKMATERQELYLSIERMAQDLKSLEGKECVIEGSAKKYFNCHYSENNGKKIFLYAERNSRAITAAVKLCGYFCLISSDKMTAKEAYLLYQGRDASEKLFRADKTFLGSKSMRIHSNEALDAKIFIEFLALIIRNRFFNLLKDEMLRLQSRKNYMTVPASIKELEKIEMTKRSDKFYKMDFALTKTQKTILQCFGLSAEDVIKRLDEISKQLHELNDVIIPEDETEDGQVKDYELD